MALTQWLTFLGISFLVIATPGQDTALTVRNALRGRKAGVFTALGVVTGQLVWTFAASTGVTAILVASEPAFRALKLAGAIYLVYLGAVSIWGGLRRSAKPDERTQSRGLPMALAYRQGLVSNLGNPKVAVFFTSLLPQFAGRGTGSFGQMVLLGAIFATMTLAWLTAYAFVIDKAGEFIRRSPVRRTLDVVMGSVLIAFGWRLARASR